MNNSQFTGVNLMANRLNWHGGQPQQDRMIKDKRWSLDHATKYSYQAAKIRHTDSEDKEEAPALINPDKTKFNYDDKIVSVGFEYRYKSGDVFDWMNTNTKWIIYTRDYTELAYFKGQIRKCNYTITWLDEEGNKYTQHVAVRGPVETKINYIQKNGISVDTPNHSLNIYMTKTPEATKYFDRYAKFYLGGIEEYDKNTCWRIEAMDAVSTDGLIQINAVEYYANETRDDLEESLVDALVLKPIDPNEGKEEVAAAIKGETFIKPKLEYKYFYRGNENSQWSVEKKAPVQLIPDGKKVIVKWMSGYSGQFVLKYGSSEKTIVVESLF